ncbi:MAG TPA: hypothetical protein VG755_25135 [Nannocystaceae bacterium]|nr:hypothetical protein [Nannocystaceae bacterium]
MRRIEALLITRLIDVRPPRDPTRVRRIAIACACVAGLLVAVLVALAP